MSAPGMASTQARELPPLVLIVSANWAWASGRRLLLKQNGCTAIVATGMSEVFQFLTIQTFHLVLVDVKAAPSTLIESIYRLRDIDRETRFVAATDDPGLPPLKRLLRARCLDGTVSRDFNVDALEPFLCHTETAIG